MPLVKNDRSGGDLRMPQQTEVVRSGIDSAHACPTKWTKGESMAVGMWAAAYNRDNAFLGENLVQEWIVYSSM
jgi:hypothetical protein